MLCCTMLCPVMLYSTRLYSSAAQPLHSRIALNCLILEDASFEWMGESANDYAGATIAGPAIIEEPTTTIVVYPGTQAAVSDAGNYVLKPQA